jgi:hypothetical protein
MRKLLNTLYVSTEGAYLHRDGLNVVVEIERVEKLRVPLHLLSGVAVFGQASLSPPLMGSLAEAGEVTAFFGMNGRFLARVEGSVPGNVLLRREQYRVMDDAPTCTRVSRGIRRDGPNAGQPALLLPGQRNSPPDRACWDEAGSGFRGALDCMRFGPGRHPPKPDAAISYVPCANRKRPAFPPTGSRVIFVIVNQSATLERGRVLYGARGSKRLLTLVSLSTVSRAPCGARGSKPKLTGGSYPPPVSHPMSAAARNRA